jgi:hypothetical protein
MDDDLIERLLKDGESSSLDYKRDQYPFAGATDEQKGELLKDILAFANGERHAEAYILIGVEEVQGGRSAVVGVSHHLEDDKLQQFVNSKTNRPVTFSYRAYPFEGKQLGIIIIPQQDRPTYLNKDFGRLHQYAVYCRQGTSTATVPPDVVNQWAAARKQVRFGANANLDWRLLGPVEQQKIGSSGDVAQLTCTLELVNEGTVTANNTQMLEAHKVVGKLTDFVSDWKHSLTPYGAEFVLPRPIHPGSRDRLLVAEWLVEAGPRAQDNMVVPKAALSFKLTIHCENQEPQVLKIDFDSADMQASRGQCNRAARLVVE